MFATAAASFGLDFLDERKAATADSSRYGVNCPWDVSGQAANESRRFYQRPCRRPFASYTASLYGTLVDSVGIAAGSISSDARRLLLFLGNKTGQLKGTSTSPRLN